MLRKLCRYDFRAVLRYWWIAALSVFALSLAGGGCIALMNAEKDLPDALMALAMLGVILVILGYSAFVMLTNILVFVRFYRHFFTDEGYLTFTLPVSRVQLLNAKLIVSTVTQLLTVAVCLVSALVMLVIGFARDVFTASFWQELSEGAARLFGELGIYTAVYLAEILILVALIFVFTCLFLFCCITVASIITRKAKVLVAIGIYYGANSVISFLSQMLQLFALPSLVGWLSDLPEGTGFPIAALCLFGIILFAAIFCGLLYTLQYWMLDRKLNLS